MTLILIYAGLEKARFPHLILIVHSCSHRFAQCVQICALNFRILLMDIIFIQFLTSSRVEVSVHFVKWMSE